MTLLYVPLNRPIKNCRGMLERELKFKEVLSVTVTDQDMVIEYFSAAPDGILWDNDRIKQYRQNSDAI